VLRNGFGVELELELIQTHIEQSIMLWVEVGDVPCSRCACVAHKSLPENMGAWASAQGAWLCVSHVGDSESLTMFFLSFFVCW
jgi:hypothetical protein